MNSKHDYNARRKKRRIKRMMQRLAVLLVAVVILLVGAWGVFSVVKKISKIPKAAASSAPVATTSTPAQAPAPLPATLVDNTSWNKTDPVEKTINNQPVTAPDYHMIALPENGRVEMSYFDTATFVGDSITQGLELYKAEGIPNAHYCAYKSIGPKQIYDGSIQTRADKTQEIPMEALVASAPDKVYILLGTNAMVAMDDASLLQYYKEMLAQIRASLHPDVKYYIQSITPVRPDASKLNQDRIFLLNHALAQIAQEEGIYFIDLNECLAGDDGFLREDFASRDGYHLNPKGYAAWVEYLATHTAPDIRNPYIPDAGYYLPPAPVAP